MPAESASLNGCPAGQGLGVRAAGRERARHDGRAVVSVGVGAARGFAQSGVLSWRFPLPFPTGNIG